jgi:2-methylcitrate dehydratase PrpD
MIAVYEIFARLSDATTLSRRGWDQGYAIGIATAAGVANLLKLSAEATANAVGIAATSICRCASRARVSLRRGKMSPRLTLPATGSSPRCLPLKA